MPDDATSPLRITVIVPVYNHQDDLRKCLDSLAQQTLPQDQFEVIVVDNASDESPQALVAEYPFAVFAQESKPGSYAARNKVWPQARAKYLAFTDSDCQPRPTWLEAGLRALEPPQAIDVVAGRIDVEPCDPSNPNAAELYDIAVRFDQRARVEKENGVVTANMLTRREIFDDIGPFDDSLMSGADALWSMRAADHGYSVVFVDDVPVVHPTRTSLKTIRVQSRRYAHGKVDISAQQSSRGPLYLLPIAIRKIFPRVAGTWGMRQKLKQRGYGWWAWLKVLGILQIIHYGGTFSQIRRLLGGKSERR